MARCAESKEESVLWGSSYTTHYNEMTAAKYEEQSCAQTKAWKDKMCTSITAGATGTDACGAVACFAEAQCNTGLNPPSSCLTCAGALCALYPLTDSTRVFQAPGSLCARLLASDLGAMHAQMLTLLSSSLLSSLELRDTTIYEP